MTKRFKLCILHIGTEKTGTTTIQNFLSVNHKNLAKEGYLYTVSGGLNGSQFGYAVCAIAQPWQSDLGVYLQIHNQSDREQYHKKLLNSMCNEFAINSNCHTLLISSEHFHSRLMTVDEIANLKELFFPYTEEFRIVIYLRRQDRVAVSLYSTMLKGGWNPPTLFPNSINGNLEYFYDYEAIYNNWKQVFGNEAICVRLFERAKFVNSDLIDDFCSICEISKEGKSTPPNANESLNQSGVDFLREVNRQLPYQVDRKINHVHEQISSIVANLCKGKHLLATQSEAKQFYAQYRPGNEKLKACLFPDQNPSLFDEDFSEYPESVEQTAPSYESAVQIAIQIATNLLNSTVNRPQPNKQNFSVPEFLLLNVDFDNLREVKRSQSLCFNIEFSLAADINELVIGIHLLDEYDRTIFSSNTTMLNQPLHQVERGTHQICYKLVADLPEGQYTVGFDFIECNKLKDNRKLAQYNKLFIFRVSEVQAMANTGYMSLPVEFDYQKKSDIVLGMIKNAVGTLTSDAVLGNIAVKEVFDLPVLLENASGQTWVSTWFNPVNLSYHWLDQTGNILVFDGKRTPLPAREVLPGQTLTTQMKVMAPDVPGLYRLTLLPVQEKHCWFDKCGFTPGMLELEVVASGAARYIPAADLRLLSQVGKREESSIISTGCEGFLLFGPYLRFPAGQYVARLEGSCELGTPGIWLDVVCDQAKRVLVRQEIIENAKPGLIAEQFFELAEMVNDLEVRLWVTANALVHIEALRIEPSISDIKATELPEIIEVSEISPSSSALQ